MKRAAAAVSFHIAVFARAPIAGNAKTRLIPLLGAQGAAALQRKLAWHTLQVACAAAPGQVSLWAADTPGHPFFAECAAHFALHCQLQCEGDLGRRMADCLQRQLLQHQRVLLIGTDCPVWTAAALRAAAQALKRGVQLAFTPAADGGYVLVGARRDAVSLGAAAPAPWASAFQEIDWGTPQVMAQTRCRLAARGWQCGREWQELPALWDIDTPHDFLRAQRAGLL